MRGFGSRAPKPRRTIEVETAGGARLSFASRGALLRWAREEARRLFPGASAPVVRRTARPAALWALPSRAALDEWLTRPKNVRYGPRGPAVLIGRIVGP